METYLPIYDAVHIISDIHMGGTPDFQILRETQRLAAYINRLVTERPGKSVALVLNGDVFDTLAEDLGSDYVATRQAEQVVTRIMNDGSFRRIWDALAKFTQTPQRTLVFVIGNHDIEISFPGVQRLLVNRLAGNDQAARARIEFSTTGAGYTCVVGGARVYCTHGNEFDAWNYNRYEDLARVGRRLNCYQWFDPKDWRPNAGTKMVKDVMNDVKKRYRWIDLLKPENSAAIGTLLAIDPSQIKRLRELPDIVFEQQAGKREAEGRLSVPGAEVPATARAGTAPPSLEQWLGSNLRAATASTPQGDEMLLAALRRKNQPGAAEASGTLGTGQLIVDSLFGWITGIDKPEALRRALKDWLKDDHTFDIGDHDETCTAAMKNVGAAVDVVVTGHTHLARAIDLGGGRLYFNSGTWIRLMRFTDAMLKDGDSFKPVYGALLKGTMAELDAAKHNGEPLVMDYTTEIELFADDQGLVGRLNKIEGNGKGDPQPVRVLRRV